MSFERLTEKVSVSVETGHGDLAMAICIIPCTLGCSLLCWAFKEGITKVTWRYEHQGEQRSKSWTFGDECWTRSVFLACRRSFHDTCPNRDYVVPPFLSRVRALVNSDPQLFDQYAAVLAAISPRRLLPLIENCGQSMVLLVRVLDPKVTVQVQGETALLLAAENLG